MSSSKWRAQFDGKSLVSVRYVSRNGKTTNSHPSNQLEPALRVARITLSPNMFAKNVANQGGLIEHAVH